MKANIINTRQEIKDELIALNFNLNSRGFDYWVEAIKLYRDYYPTYKQSTIQYMYDILSKNFGVKDNQIERSMRYSRNKICDDKIRKKYNYEGKLSNKVVLLLIGGI